MQLQTGRVRRDLGAMRPRCTAHPESRSDRTHDARATRWSRACGPQSGARVKPRVRRTCDWLALLSGGATVARYSAQLGSNGGHELRTKQAARRVNKRAERNIVGRAAIGTRIGAWHWSNAGHKLWAAWVVTSAMEPT